MTLDEVKLFMACIKINGYMKTAKIYNCAHGTVSNKRQKIMAKYNVVYS